MKPQEPFRLAVELPCLHEDLSDVPALENLSDVFSDCIKGKSPLADEDAHLAV